MLLTVSSAATRPRPMIDVDPLSFPMFLVVGFGDPCQCILQYNNDWLRLGRMRRIQRGSNLFQFKPFQKTITTWQLVHQHQIGVIMLEVLSPAMARTHVTVSLIVNKGYPICLEIPHFNFWINVGLEDQHKTSVEELVETTEPELSTDRPTRFERDPVI